MDLKNQYVFAITIGLSDCYYWWSIFLIDSIQTLVTDLSVSAPGSVTQVRDCAAHLTQYAKQTNTILLMIGHVTKGGALAGP